MLRAAAGRPGKRERNDGDYDVGRAGEPSTLKRGRADPADEAPPQPAECVPCVDGPVVLRLVEERARPAWDRCVAAPHHFPLPGLYARAAQPLDFAHPYRDANADLCRLAHERAARRHPS